MTEENKTTAEEAIIETEATETNVGASTENAMSEEDLKAVEGVKERLRFFFSDANVRQDVFLRRLLLKEEDGRAVPIKTMLRFNTIKKLTENPVVLIQAAKELNDMLVVDEEKGTLSRVVPFTMHLKDGNIPKSLYIKNLPLKDGTADGDGDPKSATPPKQYDVTVDEIRALFAKYGDVAMVKFKFSPFPGDGADDDGGDGKQRRYTKRKSFHPKGAAMIEFHNQEDLDRAAGATLTVKGGEMVEPKDKLVLEGNPNADLEVMLLSEYVEQQKKEKEKNKNEKGPNKRSREDDDEEAPEENELPKFLVDWKPGCVIKMRGLPAACDREAIMDMLAKGLDISLEELKSRKIYADYSRGQTDGAIRFPQPDDKVAEVAKRLKDGDLTIQDVKLEEALVLEGDEEKKYWDEFIAFKTKQIQHKAEEKRAKQQSQKKKFRRGGRARH